MLSDPVFRLQDPNKQLLLYTGDDVQEIID